MNSRTCPVNAGFMCVGDDVVMLGGDYDPDQMWLPFMTGAIFRSRLPEPAPEPKEIGEIKPFAAIWHEHRRLYPHDGHRDQILLPFHEDRAVTIKEWIQLSKVNHPGFETDSGGLIKVAIKSKESGRHYRFCEEKCRGRFFIKTGKIYFSDSRDAVLFRLSMGGVG